jgi:MoaA/NifB/PqqE/SkfB family radical SAM enzyme
MPFSIARQIVQEGSGLFPTLHFTGGETFVYRRLFDLIELGLELDYGDIVINTNGTLVTPAVAARLASYGPRLHITVSLDGPQHTHDPVRGAGRFQQTAQGIDALLAAGVRVTVMSVVTPPVLAVLSSFVRQLYAAHPEVLGVTLFPVGVGPAGTQKPGVTLHPLTPTELRELALAVALLYKAGYNVGVAAYPMINPLLTALGYPRARLYHCTAGRGRVCVHADLSVSTCHPVKDPVYGRWQSGLLRRLHEFPVHQRLARRDFLGCTSCALKEECGHCRAYVIGAGQPLFGNDHVCRDVLTPVLSAAQGATLPAAGAARVPLPVLPAEPRVHLPPEQPQASQRQA